MVHRDGYAHHDVEPPRQDGPTLRQLAQRSDQFDALGAGAGQNRIGGMIATRPDWVISRQRAWGVPITLFIKEKPGRLGRDSQRSRRQCAHHRRLRGRGRRCLVQAGRARTLSRQARQRGLAESRRHSRRLVRFRLDARLRARGPDTLSGARRHPPQARRRRRGGDVSRRLRPAPRLVSVVAAGILRHARGGAVRHRGHARLHARRARPQNVEVARQHGGAAGCDQAIGRRYPAAVDLRDRLLGRPAHRPGNPENVRRDLSQAAQHAALDAGQSRASARRRARGGGGHAGARAPDAASAGRARSAGSRSLRAISTSSASSPRSTPS